MFVVFYRKNNKVIVIFLMYTTYRVRPEADGLILAVIVQLDLLPPHVDNGTITQFDIYLGEVDARRLNLSASQIESVNSNKVYKSAYLHIIRLIFMGPEI